MFEDLIPELQEPARALVLAAGQAWLLPRVTSTRRSHSAQVRLYRRWQAGLSPLPVALPGTSPHEFGYAFDLVVSPYEALGDVGYTWETWGGVWGGDKDPVHFQYPGFIVPPQETSYLSDILSIFYPLKAVDVLQGVPAEKTQDYATCVLYSGHSASECRKLFK